MFDYLNQSKKSVGQQSKNKNTNNIKLDRSINFLSNSSKHFHHKDKKLIKSTEEKLHYPEKNVKSKTPKQSFLVKLNSLFNHKDKKILKKEIVKAPPQVDNKKIKLNNSQKLAQSSIAQPLLKKNANQISSKNNIMTYSTFKSTQPDKNIEDKAKNDNDKKIQSFNTSSINNNIEPININKEKITATASTTSNRFNHNILHQVHHQDSLEDEDTLEVNLLPTKKKHFSANQVLLSYFMIIIISLLASITPYIYFRSQNKVLNSSINIYKNQVNLVNNKNKELSEKVSLMKPFSIKLQNLLPLLNSHVYWSDFFPILERYTVGNVYYVSLNMSDTNIINLSGKALSLRDLAEQLVVLQQDSNFIDVSLDTFSFVEPELPNDPKIEFSLSYSLSPKIIKNNKDK